MRRAAIRAAIALYPRSWRRRYGPELEECARRVGTGGALAFVALLVDLLVTAARERARIATEHSGLIGLAIAVALVPLVAAGVAMRHRRRAETAPPPVVSPLFIGRRTAHIGAGKSGIVVRLNPRTGAAVSIMGAPSQTELNPMTGQILAISRRSAG